MNKYILILFVASGCYGNALSNNYGCHGQVVVDLPSPPVDSPSPVVTIVENPNYAKAPGQDRAQEITWHEVLGMFEEPAPFVKWDNNIGSNLGLYYDNENTIIVAWRGTTISATAYAHEHIHAFQHANGYSDPNHLIAADWALVKVIADALDKENL